jgi:tetratricopeptide (TPR) repeat protein
MESNMHARFKSAFTFTAALLVAGGISLGTAFAAGGDSDGGAEASTPKQKCKTGQVWDPDAATLFGKGKCVAAADVKKPDKQKQGMIYDYGKWLAKAGDFEDAIATLLLAPDQDDPRVLNYLGYSHRKLGKMDAALGYYHAAVAQNPDFSLVREYLGEAYIQLGELEAAREQLTQIERICGGRACDEYGQLADLIVESQAQN